MDPRPPTLILIAQDAHDARVWRRVRALQSCGWEVVPMTFRRPRSGVPPPPGENIDLGPTADRDYLQRAAALVRALPRLWRHRRLLAEACAFYAVNFDNGLLAILARRGGRRPLFLEIADIQPVMWRRGAVPAALRLIERVVLRASRALITTSPEFVSAYFTPLQGCRTPVFLLENKVHPSAALRKSAPAPPAPGPPWRIGYFGAFRCPRSWELIRRLARALPDRVEFHLRGFPTAIPADQLAREAAELPNVIFGGSYRYPDELAQIYGGIHLNWCFDFADASNARHLLPNRIYEGGLFAVPALGDAATATGRWIAREGAGWTFSGDLATGLENFLRQLQPDEWTRVREACASRPERFAGEDDYRALSRMMAAAAEEACPEDAAFTWSPDPASSASAR